MTQLDIEIEPAHQAVAARLGLALVDGDADRVDAALTEAATAGLEPTLAMLAVQSRNLVAALMLLQGLEDTRAVFQRTILDAKLAADE
ncbi:hypothetical protein [Mycolicibacterium palauense]|uniref:hypothetical protein n=1 Tax=Mycolicibacterium palauense TaxID=2034511 RepID=UPI000BFEB912|nr:hypothetical protein [Mycolicibacterium palauense]